MRSTAEIPEAFYTHGPIQLNPGLGGPGVSEMYDDAACEVRGSVVIAEQMLMYPTREPATFRNHNSPIGPADI